MTGIHNFKETSCDKMKSLAELKPGERAIIKLVNIRAIGLKLMEMGCIPGETVSLSKQAPLGCPIAISIGPNELSIRKEEAAAVMVELL